MVFDASTLTVQTKFGDVDERLDSIELDLGIDQGWTAESEIAAKMRVNMVGHRKALAMTLWGRIEDINDAACRGPFCCSEFSQSTGNSTNNLDAATQQHTLRNKAIKTSNWWT